MAKEPDEGASLQLELTDASAATSRHLEERREALLKAVNSCELTTIETKVAWLLNHFPKTRDSDLTLQIRYWQNFQPNHFDGTAVSVLDYYRLTKLTTLARARATIQNRLKLFQASDEVKKRRKQLQEGEQRNALKKRANFHRFAVYLDESGKTQDNLVIGSMWFLDGAETIKIFRLISDWKTANRFEGEFHFQSISEAKLPNYRSVADLIAANSATISFKAISVPRRGISDQPDALLKLAYHLLVRGLEHEHSTGRAPLPRGIQVCKDAEEIGQDRLFTAELADRMKQAAVTQFNGELYVEEFSAEESASNILLQLTDLFTSSLGRQLNVQGERRQPKDRFADYFLQKLGFTSSSEALGDVTVHIAL